MPSARIWAPSWLAGHRVARLMEDAYTRRRRQPTHALRLRWIPSRLFDWHIGRRWRLVYRGGVGVERRNNFVRSVVRYFFRGRHRMMSVHWLTYHGKEIGAQGNRYQAFERAPLYKVARASRTLPKYAANFLLEIETPATSDTHHWTTCGKGFPPPGTKFPPILRSRNE